MKNLLAYSNSTHEKASKTQFSGDLSNIEKTTTISHRCDMTANTTPCQTATIKRIKTQSSRITNANVGPIIIAARCFTIAPSCIKHQST